MRRASGPSTIPIPPEDIFLTVSKLQQAAPPNKGRAALRYTLSVNQLAFRQYPTNGLKYGACIGYISTSLLNGEEKLGTLSLYLTERIVVPVSAKLEMPMVEAKLTLSVGRQSNSMGYHLSIDGS